MSLPLTVEELHYAISAALNACTDAATTATAPNLHVPAPATDATTATAPNLHAPATATVSLNNARLDVFIVREGLINVFLSLF